MTSPSAHLDLDALADALARGAGGTGRVPGAGGRSADDLGRPDDDHAPDRAADLTSDLDSQLDSHLAGCGSCTSRLHELAAADTRVVAQLRALPLPALPAGLADRLAAALAAEPPLRPAVSSPGAASPGAASISDGAGGDRAAGTASTRSSVTALPAASARRRQAWLPAAAAAVLVVSGAGIGVALLGDGLGSTSSEDSATAAGALTESGPAASDLLLTASGTDWADPDAAGALAQVLSGATERVALSGGAAEDGAGPDAASAGPDGDTAAPSDDVAPLAVPEDALATLRTPEGLAACLSSLLPPDEPDLVPLAVDYATYAGQPALAVLLPDPDPAQVSIFVVGAGCSAADDGTLFFLRAPRP